MTHWTCQKLSGDTRGSWLYGADIAELLRRESDDRKLLKASRGLVPSPGNFCIWSIGTTEGGKGRVRPCTSVSRTGLKPGHGRDGHRVLRSAHTARGMTSLTLQKTGGILARSRRVNASLMLRKRVLSHSPHFSLRLWTALLKKNHAVVPGDLMSVTAKEG